VFLAAGLPLAAHEHADVDAEHADIDPEDLKGSHPENPDSGNAP
jgi:hypothetical protein